MELKTGVDFLSTTKKTGGAYNETEEIFQNRRNNFGSTDLE